ncbi:glycosyl hydrolase family 71-domain-containing protein [Xylariales sp. PMI_506]|nr:glycosyl hydrolase family 71-domain-containing protein [Xylariales sp. PMI_506]
MVVLSLENYSHATMTPLLWMVALLAPCQVQAAAVFAHFMVGNVPSWDATNWFVDISDAHAVGIDAFALNIAAGYEYNDLQIGNAFAAAEKYFDTFGFQLFFSFDYAGNGAWAEQDVIDLINTYSSSEAYYKYDGKPFVSTFEGPGNADDWVTIKSDTGCYLVPDWSSAGATVAIGLGGGVADGLFSWAAWPYAGESMSTYVDASYSLALDGKPYMMAVSPWFYTNLPGYDKDWLWNSGDLWYDRWQQAIFYSTGGNPAPEWIEILTWNDFGESHYIGPLDDSQYDAFTIGEAPYNYAEAMPHDGWRTQLKWVTDLYKTGSAESGEESIVMWYRTSFASACGTGDTTGNTASQLQIEYSPADIVVDQISISVLLASPVDSMEVLYGPNSYTFDWTYTPEGGAGLYYATFALPDLDSGEFGVWLYRDDGTGFHLSSTVEINHTCTNDITNWNAYVSSTYGGEVDFSQDVSDYVCVKGWGDGDFNSVCEFVCGLGYCPSSACVCQQWGAQPTTPTDGGTPVDGYPADGDPNWDGLCAFVCGLGDEYCSKYSDYCSEVPTATNIPTVSPFTHNACTAGTGIADFQDLCEWSCSYGYCPIDGCECTAQGVLVIAPDQTAGVTANFTPIAGNWRYNDLCTWTCSRGYCPDVCSSSQDCVSGTGDGNYAGLCDFSCGRGFCPDPCTCQTYGTADPGTVDPLITGYAAPGLDQATYDPLCNFTCSHGYCPSPNACVSSVVGDADLTESIPALPTLADYNPDTETTYNIGDFERYDFADDPDVSISILYTGSVAELPTDIVCDDVTPGTDGDFLGCVGETVEWLMLSLMDDPDAITSRGTSSSNYSYAPLSDWQSEPDCDTHCRLQKQAPLNTWVPVGEGTYNGRNRSLHFMNTGSSLVYKAHPTSIAEASIEKRFIHVVAAAIALSVGVNTALFTQIHDPNKHPIIASHVSMAAMDAAVEKMLDSCVYLTVNDTSLVPDGTDPTGFGMMIGTSSSLGVDADEVDSLTTTCQGESTNSREYIIWPTDGNNVASLRALLLNFDAATDEHISVNSGYGTMYFRAFLTMAQVVEVTQNKEAKEAEVKCTDDCENPADRYIHEAAPHLDNIFGSLPTKVNYTENTPSKVKERDDGWTTQAAAVPELAFISQPSGGSRTSYIYDSSAGFDVPLYILDPECFDTSISEFTLVSDENDETIEDKTLLVSVGKSGWQCTPTVDDHGTHMLVAAAGGTYGIARKSSPHGYTWQIEDSSAWIIDALDLIEANWREQREYTPLGVLSMSFGVKIRSGSTSGFRESFAARLRTLDGLGLLLVCSTGNEGVPIYKTPAVFADPSSPDYIPNLLLVGSVDNNGAATYFSNTASYVTLFAPGVDVTVPSSGGTTTISGTSVSVAKVSGLASYFLGLSSIALESVADLKAYMLETAYARVSGYPAIYNTAPA